MMFRGTILFRSARSYSNAVTAALTKDQPALFRTSENSPSNHSKTDLSQFYSISNDTKAIFQFGGFPKNFQIQIKTFCESCLMIRNPALDIINCLKNTDYTKPVVRYVVYGKQGTGKSLTMAHIMHYAFENNYLLVHVPWVANWMRRSKEYTNSSTREGYVDLPIDAAAWLIHFRTQNAKILASPDLTISKDYVWSKREVTPKGAKLLDLIEHGINRIKFASDCVVSVAEEIKKLSTEKRCRTLVAIDGYNAFFYPHTRVYTDAKVAVPPSKVTLTEAFLELTKYNWCNGAVVVTVDELAVPEIAHGSPYPFELLGKAGFEHLDPFIPVRVDNYTKKEFESCMMYYRDRIWLQTPGDIEIQNQELEFLSGKNPFKLMQLCAPL